MRKIIEPIVKINKGKLIKNVVRSPEWRAPHTLQPAVRSIPHIPPKKVYFTYPSRRKEEFLLAQEQPNH